MSLSEQNLALYMRLLPNAHGELGVTSLNAYTANRLLDAARAVGAMVGAAVHRALQYALEFGEMEAENRSGAGALETDYEHEAQEVADLCRSALDALSRPPLPVMSRAAWIEAAAEILEPYGFALLKRGHLTQRGHELCDRARMKAGCLFDLTPAVESCFRGALAKFVDFEDRYDADKSVSDDEVRTATAEAKALLEGKAP